MSKQTFSQEPYYIGLDIGTDSVGYAVTHPDYSLCKWKGEPMMGVHLFDGANTCAERRAFRIMRRRNHRRQQRILLIQELFAHEMNRVDPDFFIRQSESRLLKRDRSADTLCECDWDDKTYHQQYPTIHHLIKHLMESTEGTDIRHLYLAVAWLVAHRGHFLMDADPDRTEDLIAFDANYRKFMDWFPENDWITPWDDPGTIGAVRACLCRRQSQNAKYKELIDILFGGAKDKTREGCPFKADGLLNLLAGKEVKVNTLMADGDYRDCKEVICLGKPDTLENTLPLLGDCAEGVRLLAQLFDGAALAAMLDDAGKVSGGKVGYISCAKVAQYETHRADLKNLKYLIRKYCPSRYSEMFRLPKSQKSAKDGEDQAGKKQEKNNGYAAYSRHFPDGADQAGISRDDFYKCVRGLLKSIQERVEEADRGIVADMEARMDTNTYMPLQVSPDNRLIPYQLFDIELRRILACAQDTYPFLSARDTDGLTVSDKILAVFRFRTPYYVGPLCRSSRYAWLERKPTGRIYPWNFDQMVDLDASENAFIRRMTNKCTYLPGEDVLPRWSLLYAKFSVLNVINNLTIDGVPIRPEEKQILFDELFRKNRKVTFRRIADFWIARGLIKKGEALRIGGIDTASDLSCRSLVDFFHMLYDRKLSEEDVEVVILHLTCTTEVSRFKKWLRGWIEQNGKALDEGDIQYLSSLKYRDFGTLSRKLLNGIEGTSLTTGETGTVMHFLWHTNDNLMQIIADPNRYTFCETIRTIQRDYYAEHPANLQKRLEEMGVSNAVKRPIFRSLDIVSDIVKAKRGTPARIFVEMARGASADERKRTVPRKKQILDLYKGGQDVAEIDRCLRELNGLGDGAEQRLQSEALYLYFRQLGRCMYCGKEISLTEIKSGRYNIDHIWPRAYVKDDSILQNKVLVCSEENGKKGDSYPLPAEWRAQMHGWWESLLRHKLIGEEKFRRLTRQTPFTAEEKQGFVNRQLVETRQSTKAVTALLAERYPDTEIVFVKAGLVSEFRHEFGNIRDKVFRLGAADAEKNEWNLVKSRMANDIHHAQDAYLNIVAGNVYHERFTRLFRATEPYSLKLPVLFGNPLARDLSVWEPVRHLPTVETVMENRHIYLTKYPMCQHGGLFDQQPKRAGGGALIPLKQGMDPNDYGGYQKPTVSFFVLLRYRSGGKWELTLFSCPLMDVARFRENPEAYVRGRLPAQATDVSFPLGRRDLRVNTAFSLDGFIVCLAGKTGGNVCLRSLMTPHYTRWQIRYIKKIENVVNKEGRDKTYRIDPVYDGITEEGNLRLYDALVEKMQGYFSGMPGAKPCVANGTRRHAFERLSPDEQIKVLKNMIQYLKTNRAGGCDMRELGGKAGEGIVLLSANLSNWAKRYRDVRIVDRSASGLFEHRSVNLMEWLR